MILEEGLSKATVKKIIKFCKDAPGMEFHPVGKLNGLLYDAENECYMLTDGFVAIRWLLQPEDKPAGCVSLVGDYVPKESGIIKVEKLKAWVANAGAKDVLKYSDLPAMLETQTIPNLSRILDDYLFGSSTQVAPRFNLSNIARVTDIVGEVADFSLGKMLPKDDVGLMYFRTVGDRENPGLLKEVIVMGMKKN